jgi:type III pantothenate kinase
VSFAVLLTIDIGNSNIVFGIFAGERLIGHGRFSSRRDYTTDEIQLLVHSFLSIKEIEIGKITGVAICSVVPVLEHAFVQSLSGFMTAPVLVVSPGIRTGIPIRYENPKEVGADRIVNAVAAYAEVKGGVMVVDFGTAITFDCISEEGAYLGGAISPGIHIAAEALYRNTAKLPFIDPEPPDHVVGRNTVESLKSGIFYGFASLVEGMIRRIHGEMGKVPVYATGGWAEVMAPHIPSIEKVDPWLTLKGLKILYERNLQR